MILSGIAERERESLEGLVVKNEDHMVASIIGQDPGEMVAIISDASLDSGEDKCPACLDALWSPE
jgi:hypothetical protein